MALKSSAPPALIIFASALLRRSWSLAGRGVIGISHLGPSACEIELILCTHARTPAPVSVKTSSLTGASQAKPASCELQRPACLHPISAQIPDSHTMASCLHRCWGFKLGPCICRASTLSHRVTFLLPMQLCKFCV